MEENRNDERDKTAPKLYVSGDCHMDYTRFNTRNFPEGKTLTKEDAVIICGDFGYGFCGEKELKHQMDWLEEKPFTVLFVDGNHENFDLLNALPTQEWHGGKVHAIRPSVLHLMRGQVYEFGGKTLFTFGGASSHDCEVILEPDDPNRKHKEKRLKTQGILYRINRVNWWREELSTQKEMEEGLANLEEHNWSVDYIFTHCCPSAILEKNFPPDYKQDVLTAYLEKIRQECEYQKWFFGHYHINRNLNEAKAIAIYEQIIRIL